MTPAAQRINIITSYLNDAEQKTLLFVAERIKAGRATYGPLDPNDGRVWRKELGEELADALVYLGIWEVSK